MPSIIIPCYNEEKNIQKTVKELQQLKKQIKNLEIIVVDDGSQDKTTEKAEETNADKVVSYTPNKGKGHAMRKGVENTDKEKILFTDADQHQIEKIPRFLEELEPNTIVIGKRNYSLMPWPRRINNALAKLAVFLATGKSVEDPICGIRAINKKDFQELELKENRFEVESEINLKAIKKGIKLKYIPVEIHYPDRSFEFNELNWGQSRKLATYLAKSVIRSWMGKEI